MKIYFFIIPLLFLVTSCNKNTEKQQVNSKIIISKNVNYTLDDKELNLTSHAFSYHIPRYDLPFKRIILLNASLVGYISALDMENSVIGVTSPEYIYTEKIHDNLENGKTENVGNSQKYDIEKIISLKPDAIFTNYIPNFQNIYDLLKKSGIKVIFFNEYLEELPLEKSAYIKVFGELLGKQNKADSLYNVIHNNYNNYKNKAEKANQTPSVLTNEIFGNQWYMPGGKTQIAHYLNDANSNYIFKDNQETKAIPMTFEEVYAFSETANYWVNVGNYSTKKELLMANPNYKELNVFKNGQIFSINGRVRGTANDYFESGAVRVDWVLRDYIKAFHPDLMRNEKFTYLKKLK